MVIAIKYNKERHIYKDGDFDQDFIKSNKRLGEAKKLPNFVKRIVEDLE